MPIKKILVANRGEIAVRIIRAAHELGIKIAQVHSDVDQDMLAVHLADEAIEIGPPQASKSYLNAEKILEAAVESNSDAVHPGYGFLAENAEFADAVTDAGLIFIGPSGDTIRQMADKASARKIANAAGLPIIPGSVGYIENLEEGCSIAEKLGFPVMIKAAAGGGGRGIRVARDLEEFQNLAPQAGAEAKAAFGDGRLYVEKVIEHARHIEVQVVGDGRNVVHFYERDCSLQRRHQKLWEEAPASILAAKTREKLCASAVALAKSVDYKGVGTVEYLYDMQTHRFYFIEMNTRIQVEHPVTEMITGMDLMRGMILISAGEKIPYSQTDIATRGHAIEVRLNAEDPADNFMPHPGIVKELILPGGPGVRFDGLIYPGYSIPPFYDSLLGKLIVHDESREMAIDRLQRALGELRIRGVNTTQPLFSALTRNDEIRSGNFDTGWLPLWLEANSYRLNG